MKPLLIFLFTIFLFLANSVFAQDVYELTYQFKEDPAKTTYRGLLFSNSDSTGFLRLTAINKKTKKRVLYDFTVSLKSNEISEKKKSFLLADSLSGTYLFTSSDEFTIKEGKQITNIDQLQLWFKQDSLKRRVEPSLQTPYRTEYGLLQQKNDLQITPLLSEPDSAGTAKLLYEKTGIASFKGLRLSSFSKTYLRQYFTNSELYYDGQYSKKLVLAVRNNTKPVLYLISVVNTGDDDIKATCIADGKNVTHFFSRVASKLGLPYVEKAIQGNNFNAVNVRAAIKNIYPGKDDIVVFHYSGHGFSYKDDDQNLFPEMALYYGTPPNWVTLKKQSINIEEIFNTIKAKGARLNLVLSDCCNTFIKKRRDEIIDTVDRDRGDKEINVRVAMSLFMKAKASMLISAAMKGQKAKGSVSYNGFFTTSFLESLGLGLMSMDTDLQWMNIIEETEGATMKLATEYKTTQNIIYRVCDTKNNIPCVQNMQYKAVK